MRRTLFWSIGGLIVALLVAGLLVSAHNRVKNQAAKSTAAATTPQPTSPSPAVATPAPVSPAPAAEWQSPLGDPASRVTKIKFGMYVTPQNAPISPEHFTGYHTGWDFETTAAEANSDVTVTAFCAGTLKVKEWASGYGGVAVESCTLQGQAVTIIYGHLNIDSVATKVGANLAIGDKIGLLGAGQTHQTDGERKHLHFDIHKGTAINIQGYVSKQSDLSGWIDPATYLGKLP